jgi:acetyltransferase-like isoleucine patch superfamily enzyme
MPFSLDFSTLWSRFLLRRCFRVGKRVSVEGRLWIHGEGRLTIGDRVHLDARRAPIELHASRGAEIVIGEDTLIEGGTSIEARESVVIRERSRLRAYCKVLDNHFHQVSGSRKQIPESSSVVVGPDAEIGERSIVLPGARVGAGTVVGPSKVVRAPPPATRATAQSKR